MTLPPPPESSPVSTSSRGPRLGGSIFPASREAPIELGRYAVVSMLGKGGMGVVYEAVDRERGQVVALKTLRSLDPNGLRRLKAEFRSVADIVHRNLVLLHELVSDGDDTFFVMDYVAGENFLDHVRGKRMSPREKSRAEPLAATLPEPVVRTERTDDDDVAPPLDPSRFDRLGETIIQVVCGLSALHKAGKFHRDVKPTNVRVTAQGRAVVLDFGLVKGEVGLDLYGPTAGTPAYMAPEQVLGQPVSAATDLYAVGVMMYEVLVGRRPFAGSPLFVLASKVNAMPPRPRSYAPWLPEHLDALCMDLLATAPEARPSAAEVVRRLGGDPEALATGTGEGLARSEISSSQERNGPVSAPPVMSSTSPFHPQGDSPQDARPPSSVSPGPLSSSQNASSLSLVGRERELSLLAEAYADVKRGNTVAVAVSGHSGVGKSSVVRAFLDGLRASGEATLLEGRCYERESVRFKAFDEVVDALGQQLRFVPWQERAQIVPDGIGELSRIFPVLADLAIAAGARPDERAVEPVELQRRAFACLKGILGRLSAQKPIVVYIDDLQWSDKDSGRLLVELLSPPERPPFLLVTTFRREEVATSPALAALTHPDLRDRIRDLHVGPLSFQGSCDLARRLFAAADPPPSDEVVAAVARESDGNPFFVGELVRHVSAGGAVEVSLSEVVTARLSGLSERARRTLEVVAVAGRPLEQGIVEKAAGLSNDARAVIATLRAHGLVRTRGARQRDTIETYHDRIREHASGALPDDQRRARHLAIASALEGSGRADARDLALHFHGAGDFPRAYTNARKAAELEAEGLAFDRAAELFSLALDCAPRDIEDIVRVRVRLAETLVCAGRSAEAAPHFLTAAAESREPASLDLRRLAAEQLLVSGRIDEGVEVLRPVLEKVGLSYPETPRRAVLAMLTRIAALEIRGTGTRTRPEAEVPKADLARVDVAWSAGKGLLAVDSVRGAYFFVRTLELALRAGEPRRVARSLAMYGMMNVFGGDRGGERRGMALIEKSLALAESLEDPSVLGTIDICFGTAKMSLGQWLPGLELMERGIETLESRAIGVGWECATGRSSCHNARIWRGDLAAIGKSAPSWSRASERVGDRYSWVTAELYTAITELAANDPKSARRRAEKAIARWTDKGFHYQHWLALKVHVWCDLYEGRTDDAYRRLASAYRVYERSGLERVLLMRLDALLLRATVALAASPHVPSALAEAERDAKALEREDRPAGRGAAALVRGGIATARRESTRARTEYSVAARELRRADVLLHAAAAALARLPRAPDEQAEHDAGLAHFTSMGIAAPERFLRVLAPISM